MSETMPAKNDKQELLNTVLEMRRSYREMIPLAGTGEVVLKVEDIIIKAGAPVRDIPLRLYYPSQVTQTKLPIFLFIHGGGFTSGDLDTHDVLARAISSGARCIVVSVDYRLAPENPFPAGLEDVYAALLWVRDNASGLGGDEARIIVGGDSAGGNLAVATALLSRDREGPELLGQWLMYPVLSYEMDTNSWERLGDKYFPTREGSKISIAAYIPEDRNLDDPLAALSGPI